MASCANSFPAVLLFLGNGPCRQDRRMSGGSRGSSTAVQAALELETGAKFSEGQEVLNPAECTLLTRWIWINYRIVFHGAWLSLMKC